MEFNVSVHVVIATTIINPMQPIRCAKINRSRNHAVTLYYLIRRVQLFVLVIIYIIRDYLSLCQQCTDYSFQR